MKEKTKKILLALLIAYGVINVVAIMALTYVTGSVACYVYECVNPSELPQPAVDSAEFDFTVTYAINGEVEICTGVIECRYVETSISEITWDKYRVWEYRIKEIEPDIIVRTIDGAYVTIGVHCNPALLMGNESREYDHCRTQAFFRLNTPENGVSYPELSEVCDDYGLRIIRFSIDTPPIENTFG